MSNFEKELKVADFIDLFDVTLFKRVASIVPNNKKASGYEYAEKDGDWNRHEGWAYMITADDHVSKIGMTEVTLGSRFGSYQAGTQKARDKGTCSVTNYNVSEFIRDALNTGVKLEIWAVPVPEHVQEVEILGRKEQVRSKHAYAHEARLLEEYQNQTGRYPLLCNNTSGA